MYSQMVVVDLYSVLPASLGRWTLGVDCENSGIITLK